MTRIRFRSMETEVSLKLTQLENQLKLFSQEVSSSAIPIEKLLLKYQEIFTESHLTEISQSCATLVNEAENLHPTLLESASRTAQRGKVIEAAVRTLGAQIEQVPQQWKEYRARYQELIKWMDSVDEAVKAISLEMGSLEEFEVERSKFQVSFFFYFLRKLIFF